jgi:hypothetical protein
MEAVHESTGVFGGTTTRLYGLGAALWMVGVVSAHLGAPFGMFAAGFAPALLLGTVPVVWLTLRLVGRVAGGRMPVLEAVALTSLPALLLDGMAFTWMPGVYSASVFDQRQAAAWLLWFVGVSLAAAVLKGARQR